MTTAEEYDYLRRSTRRLLIFLVIHDNPNVTIKEISKIADLSYPDVVTIGIQLERHELISSSFKNRYKQFILTEQGQELYKRHIDGVNPYLCKINEYKIRINKYIDLSTDSKERDLLYAQLSVLNELYCDYHKHPYDLTHILKGDMKMSE